MARFIKMRIGTKGARPGSLIYIGEKKLEKIRIRVMQFDKDSLEEKQCESVDEALSMIRKDRMTWINIDGLHDPEAIARIGTEFNISNMILEDIMNTDHRPKLQEDPGHLFIIAKLLTFDGEKGTLESDQLGLIAGDGYVISLQETTGNHFDSVRNRIRQTPVRERIQFPDYLAYSLLDCIVDNYMDIISEIGNSVEALEEEVLKNPRKETAEKIYRHRMDLSFLKKTILPMKEITAGLLRSDHLMLQKKNTEFFSDLNEHVILSQESVDAYLMMIMDQLNIYNASISNRANEIMKTLTIFASIFIPLTFIAGIYGMNFKHMPELGWKYGYAYFWGLTVIMIILLIIFFRRKKWF